MRIVSLSPSATETLSLLGLEDEIVGITPWCTMYLKKQAEKIFAGTYIAVDTTTIKKLNPDLVILQSHVHDHLLQLFRALGFNTHLLPLPMNLIDIVSNVEFIAILTNRYWEGKELADRLLNKIVEYIELGKTIKQRPKVYIEFLWPDKKVSSTGSLTYIDDGIRIAGAQNIFYDRIAKFFYVNDSEIIDRDPEIVLANIEPPYTGITIDNYLKYRPILKNTTAYKLQTIYLVEESVEANLAHPGPSFIANTMKKIIEIIKNFRRSI